MKRSLLIECIKIARMHLPKHPEIPHEGYLHYSFIIQHNKIIEWATNKMAAAQIYFGYPKHSKLHAEFAAFKKARGLLDHNKTFSIVNIRLNKSGDLRNSFPCAYCLNFLGVVGCNEIWFSRADGMFKIKEQQNA